HHHPHSFPARRSSDLTTPPFCRRLSRVRTPAASARTCSTSPPALARTRRRKASPTADSGGRYRIASGVLLASHWFSSSQLPMCRSEEHTSELQSRENL